MEKVKRTGRGKRIESEKEGGWGWRQEEVREGRGRKLKKKGIEERIVREEKEINWTKKEKRCGNERRGKRREKRKEGGKQKSTEERRL
jgi:hypothetical protein